MPLMLRHTGQSTLTDLSTMRRQYIPEGVGCLVRTAANVFLMSFPVGSGPANSLTVSILPCVLPAKADGICLVVGGDSVL